VIISPKHKAEMNDQLLSELTTRILDIKDDLKTVAYKVAQLEVQIENHIDEMEGRMRLE